MKSSFIAPDWPAPANIRALQTTRNGGFSLPPYNSLNLGVHVGDDPMLVERNRNFLNSHLPSEPVWLEQVHGTDVVLAETGGCRPRADACVTHKANAVCVVMTADCLPVLLCDQAGTVVGAVHAGWRGLLDGIVESTVQAMNVPGATLLAWLGPAIGPDAFEVGVEVHDAFMQHDAKAATAFLLCGDKYLANLYTLARLRLAALGVTRVYGGDFCTYTDADSFFSYRRDGRSGRMASLIWRS